MKYFALFSCCIAVACAVSPELQQKFTAKLIELAETCQTQTSASSDDVAQVMVKIVPTTTEGKCFLACVGKALGIQDNDGKPNKEAILTLIESVKEDDSKLYVQLVQVTEKCGAEKLEGADECETAANMMSCSLRVAEELGIKDSVLKG